MRLSISMHAHPETQEEAIQITEALSRVAAGLAFDGLQVGIQFTTYDSDD